MRCDVVSYLLMLVAAATAAADDHDDDDDDYGYLPHFAQPRLFLKICIVMSSPVYFLQHDRTETKPNQTKAYNDIVAAQVERKRKEKRAKSGKDKGDGETADKKKKGPWWGGLWRGDKGAKEEGDLAIEDLTASFEGGEEDKKAREGGKEGVGPHSTRSWFCI